VKIQVTCGKNTYIIDDKYCKDWSFTCTCSAGGCFWDFYCGSNLVRSGVAKQPPPGVTPLKPGIYEVKVSGGLRQCARTLTRLFDRPVVVPTKLRAERLQRKRLRGRPEEIVDGLGLRFGPKQPEIIRLK
jgi:hypothetical protein